ncbi:MAG: ABC transporter permease, partial [Pseudomonadota bacterium]
MRDLWDGLSAGTQDVLLLAIFLAPAVLIGIATLRGFAPWPLVLGMLRRHAGVSAAFCLLIAVSIAIGAGLTAQERGLRQGTARAADKFDLVVAAPGSEVAAMLAAVYLQPENMPLLDGVTFKTIARDERVSFAAPLAFGDSFGGAPVVGTTDELVSHLAGGPLSDGRGFTDHLEAVAGANVPLTIGETFTPTHGIGGMVFNAPGQDGAFGTDAHAGVEFRVVG